MKKLLIHIFFLLFIALGSGYSRLYAHTETMGQNTQNVQAVSTDFSIREYQERVDSYIKTALTTAEKPVEKIDPKDTEDEEDELNAFKSLSFKKLANTSGLLVPAYNGIAPQSQLHTATQQKRLQLCRHFLYVPAGKWYIYFSVYRI